MAFTLTAVDVADAEDLVRQVEFPAMQEGPWYRSMFPDASTFTRDQRETIVQFYITSLQDALVQEGQNFRQVRTRGGGEGVPVGFYGCRIFAVSLYITDILKSLQFHASRYIYVP